MAKPLSMGAWAKSIDDGIGAFNTVLKEGVRGVRKTNLRLTINTMLKRGINDKPYDCMIAPILSPLPLLERP
jgi:hypothetical protein